MNNLKLSGIIVQYLVPGFAGEGIRTYKMYNLDEDPKAGDKVRLGVKDYIICIVQCRDYYNNYMEVNANRFYQCYCAEVGNE